MNNALEVLKNIHVYQVGEDVYIGVVVPGRGFCSVKFEPPWRELGLLWKKERDAVVGEE